MDLRLREILAYFVGSNYNIIVMYNPLCREYTQRIIIYNSYTIPNQGVFYYSVNGKDITKLVEDLKNNNYINPNIPDLGLSIQIEAISKYTYEFSQNYAFELIRV